MRLDIIEVLREVGKQFPYDIQEPPLVDEDVECTQPIVGRIRFTNAGGTLLIRGKAQTCVALPCSRCDKYFERSVTLDVDEQFELHHVPAGPRTLQTVAVVEEDESPIAGKLFEGSVFHLTEMLRQYILLDQPTKPLPPVERSGACAHCHLLPEEVLQLHGMHEEESEPAFHPALAKLGQLLEKQEPDPESGQP